MAKRILVVDDDPNQVEYLKILLGENGYETDTAYDGKEGMARIRDSRPDLIVLDVMMPCKTGFVLFKQLRKDAATRNIPVIMLTGVASILEEFERAEVQSSSSSPFDSLKHALRKMILEMRSEGLVRPEMFLDKPLDEETFVANVQTLVGA